MNFVKYFKDYRPLSDMISHSVLINHDFLKQQNTVLKNLDLFSKVGGNQNQLFIPSNLEWCLISKYSGESKCLAFTSDKTFRSSDDIVAKIDPFAMDIVIKSAQVKFKKIEKHDIFDQSESNLVLNEDLVRKKITQALDQQVLQSTERVGMDPLDLSVSFYNWLIAVKPYTDNDDDKNNNNYDRLQTGLFYKWLDNLEKLKSIFYLKNIQTIEQKKLLRLQAFEAYPLLPFIFHTFHKHSKSQFQRSNLTLTGCSHELYYFENPIDINISQLSKTIDNRASLNDFFKKAGLKPWLVKKINSLKPSDLIIQDTISTNNNHNNFGNYSAKVNINLTLMLNELNRLKVDYYPKDANSWNAFAKSLNVIDNLISSLPPVLFSQVKSYILNSFKGKWDLKQIDQLRDSGIIDMQRDLAKNLIRPMIETGRVNADEFEVTNAKLIDVLAFFLLLNNRTAKKLVEQANWWHTRQPDIIRRLRHNYPTSHEDYSLKWEKITEDFSATNNYKVVCLTDSEELEMESATLQHCVRGYDYSCAYDNVHIVGVRNCENQRTSTANICLEILKDLKANDNPMQCVREHRSLRNGKINNECDQALKEWLDAIVNLKIKADYDHIKKSQQDRLAKGRKYRNYSRVDSAVYDISNKEARNAAWHEYSSLFEGDIRAAGPDGFVQECLKTIKRTNMFAKK